jgi:hypothetical protein
VSETVLSVEQQSQFVRFLAAGATVEVARVASGIDQEELDRWRAGEGAGVVEQTRATFEAKLVALLAREAANNWQTAAWLLERGFPERWARLSQRDKAEGEPVFAEVDPFEEVDELARRRAGA